MPMSKTKKQFNRIKRRIKLGMAKPGDRDKFIRLSEKLGYKNYLSEIEK